MREALVIGAGVSGLTSAVVLVEAGFDVEVIAAKLSPETTSDAAAAVWYPYHVEPREAADRWAVASLVEFRRLEREPDSGVSTIELRIVRTRGAPRRPSWADDVAFRMLGVDDLPPGFTAGYSVTVPLIDTPQYMRYLRERLLSTPSPRDSGERVAPSLPLRAGCGRVRGRASIAIRRFDSIADAAHGRSLIVNCSGFGARELCGDRELKPGRGLVLVTDNPGLPYALASDDDEPELMYVIPRPNDCILGGVDDSSESLDFDASAAAAILARCRAAVPSVGPAWRSHKAGIRPLRKSIRLEAESVDGCRVIHNYGHGGAGFTVSWGCARDVLEYASL